MNGWEEFNKKLVSIAQKEIMENFDKHKGELGEYAMNHLFDTGGPTSMDRDISQREQYFGDIFYGFNEINDSLETLKDIPVYIRSFPFRNKRITKPRYLRYHIENYFNEVYILKERLIAYLNTIKKAFKSDKHYRKVHKVTKPLYKIITEPLEGILNTRGAHVHEYRIRNRDLSRLETMELLVSSGSDDVSEKLEGYYKFSYRQIRKKWKKTFKNNNEQITELLSIYGENLLRILFGPDKQKLIYPEDMAG